MVGGPVRYYAIDAETGEERLLTAEETKRVMLAEDATGRRFGQFTNPYDPAKVEAAIEEQKARPGHCPTCGHRL